MSTRSLTVFLDDVGRQLRVIYKQHDGFPISYGKFLAKLLCSKNDLVDETLPEHLVHSTIVALHALYDIYKDDYDEWCIEDSTISYQDHAEGINVDYVYVISCYEDYFRKPCVQVFANRYKEGLKSIYCGFADDFKIWVDSLQIDKQCAVGFDDRIDKYDEDGNLIGLLA